MLRDRITILDGSYGFQLNKHLETPVDNDPLWSSKALITNPEAVIQTHMDYIREGVDIIETNTYQASVIGFTKYLNISDQEGFSLIQKAVELAKEAISRSERLGFKRPLIAGSVGPYGAYLHDGSEYTGKYIDHVPDKELREYHEPRIRALVEAGVDLLAIETIPSKKEAFVILNILRGFPEAKVWVSFCCKNDTTIYGDNFSSTAIEIYNSNPQQIIAVGVNCTAPHLIENLIKDINKDQEKLIPLIVYANSGENYNPKTGWDNNCEKLEEFIPLWLNSGVKIIGGCCRVCANYIKKIKQEVVKWEEKHNS